MSKEVKIKIEIDESQVGKRLDSLIPELKLEVEISRVYSKQLIEDAAITVNDKASKPSYKVKLGDVLDLTIPEPEVLNIEAENIPLDIVYEDDELMLINKQAGMITHPAPGVYTGTLVNAVLHHIKTTDSQLSDINGVLRPGIVHRLDKDTTGLILVAKTNRAHQSLSEQIKTRTCSRIYTCIIQGKFKDSKLTVSRAIGRHPKERIKMHSFDSVSANSNARHAKTHFKLKDNFTHKSRNFSLLEAKLDTGRTHQIRVHLSWIHKPIVGDLLYGAADNDPFKVTRPLLHSTKIKFLHPVTNEEMSFSTELPEDMAKVIDIIKA